MHILEIPSFFPPCGGLFCLDQAKALSALGHEVRILSNVQLGLTINKKDYFTLPLSRFEHVMDGMTVCQSYQRGIPRMVHHNVEKWVSIVCSMFDDYVERYGKPDILHAHCAKWAGYAAMKICGKYGVPYVITEHLPLMLLEDEFGTAPSRAWQIPLLKEAYHKASMVLPVSEELVEDTACYYGSDYRWQYLSNMIDTDFFSYQPRQSRDGRRFRFCCVADYSFRKGLDVLFAAMHQLQSEGDEVELILAGKGTDSRRCLREIDDQHLQHVKTYGLVDRKTVRSILNDSDALVLASRSEVQPLVLLEAMSTGIPTITTECIPQNLRIEGGCKIVPIDDADALAEAMKQAVLEPQPDGLKLSECVRQMASPEVVGKKLSDLFVELLVTSSHL